MTLNQFNKQFNILCELTDDQFDEVFNNLMIRRSNLVKKLDVLNIYKEKYKNTSKSDEKKILKKEINKLSRSCNTELKKINELSNILDNVISFKKMNN